MSKTSKRRFCPAVQCEISPAECGENRGSRYACPAECGFNPLAPANYSQLLEIEGGTDRAALDWLAHDAADRSALEREIQRARGAKSPHMLHTTLVWKIHFARDAAGLTCAQRWERAGFAGLKNDQRVLFRAKMGMKIALIEIQRVLDHERTEVVDLLEAEPKPFIVFDCGLASSAVRFGTGMTWIYALPHFRRLFGSAILLQEVQSFEPREVVDEIVRHLGGPVDEAGIRLWLAEHFVRFEEALHAVGVERRRLMFAQMDAKFGKAVYELKAPFAKCCEQMDESVDVDEDELNDGERREGFAEARVWFADKDDAALVRATPGTDAVLGRVLMGQSHWRVEAMGGAKLAALRERFERQMGARVKFTGERLDDFGLSMTEKDGKVNASLVPPRLLENPQLIQLSSSRVVMPIGNKTHEELQKELFAEQERRFLDDSIPALDGKTPREAARDPVLRPRLIRLMKSRVRMTDERNRDSGESTDVNWMLRELGLNEILFDPPPTGRVPRTFASPGGEELIADDVAGDEGDDDSEFEALPMDPSLPLAPPLPDRPFTFEELDKRQRAAFDSFKLAADALDRLEADGCTLMRDVDDVTIDLVDDDTFPLLVPLLISIWFTFVPPGTRGWNLTRARLRDALQRETKSFLAAVEAKTPTGLDRYLDSGPQPQMSQGLFGMLLNTIETLPKKERPNPEMQSILNMLLRAVIAELDQAQREGRSRRA